MLVKEVQMSGNQLLSLGQLDQMTLDEAQRLPREVREVLLDRCLAEGRRLLGPLIERQAGLFCHCFEEDLTRLCKLRAVRVRFSGFIPIDERGQVVSLEPRAQFRLAFDNMKRALEGAGTRPERVVNLIICLKNMDYWGEMNAVYRDYFPAPPTRAAIGVSDLNLTYQIEIVNVIAYKVAP
jgi:2-iminobutanoate/2-iminopropanoate deaminase